MIVHINKYTSVQWSRVEVLSYNPDTDITKFKVGSTWLSSKGNWVLKIEAALQVCAVAVYRSHYVLRK